MHVPDFAVVLLNQHYSALQNKAKKLNKLHSIFHKKQYIFMRSLALPCDVCEAQLWQLGSSVSFIYCGCLKNVVHRRKSGYHK
jgi:hypothetical protein